MGQCTDNDSCLRNAADFPRKQINISAVIRSTSSGHMQNIGKTYWSLPKVRRHPPSPQCKHHLHRMLKIWTEGRLKLPLVLI